MLIDSHAHLLHSRFQNEEPPLSPAELVTQAAAAGVGHIITIACRRAEWAPSLSFAAAHPKNVSIGAGIHPQDVAEEPLVEVAELLAMAHDNQVVAFGETGLDYHYENSPREAQKASFHTHLQAAREANLPVIIHTRDAEEDTVEILKQHPGVPFVLHCFTGSEWLANEALALGGFISFSGILTFKKSEELRRIATSLPYSRVLIETDAPYLAPHPYRSQRNAPSLLPHTAECLGQLWQRSVAQVAEITASNTRRLFPRLPAV